MQHLRYVRPRHLHPSRQLRLRNPQLLHPQQNLPQKCRSYFVDLHVRGFEFHVACFGLRVSGLLNDLFYSLIYRIRASQLNQSQSHSRTPTLNSNYSQLCRAALIPFAVYSTIFDNFGQTTFVIRQAPSATNGRRTNRSPGASEGQTPMVG